MPLVCSESQPDLNDPSKSNKEKLALHATGAQALPPARPARTPGSVTYNSMRRVGMLRQVWWVAEGTPQPAANEPIILISRLREA